MPARSIEQIRNLCKRRGFIFPGSAAYGGLGSFWDYGPLGVEMLGHIKRAWWRNVVYERDDMEGLDGAIITSRKVWQHSGHEATFSDPLVDCKKCRSRFRSDHISLPAPGTALRAELDRRIEGSDLHIQANQLVHKTTVLDAHGVESKEEVLVGPGDTDNWIRDGMISANLLPCPKCGAADWTEIRRFNLMFQSHVGPVATEAGTAEELASRVYLRPETAQTIFMNFKHVQATLRRRVPFGVAQIGKAFRNEITPGNFIFRTREFEQMEIEFFIKPPQYVQAGEKTDEQWHEEWINQRYNWWLGLGVDPSRLRKRAQDKAELAHYAKATTDLEYLFPDFGWGEVEGVANRTDFDLSAHSRDVPQADLARLKLEKNADSTETFDYFDSEAKARYIPWVIEPSAGVTRAMLTFLCEAYHEELVKEPQAAEVDPLKVEIDAAIKNAQKKAKEAEKLRAESRVPSTESAADKGAVDAQHATRDTAPKHDPAAIAEFVARLEEMKSRLPASLLEIDNLLEEHPGALNLEPVKKLKPKVSKLAEDCVRVVLRLHPALAPVKVAIFPLKKNEAGIVDVAHRITRQLAPFMRVQYDDSAGIGRLYRRQDEIGTPFCITVDFQTLEDNTVTLRERDSMQQSRVAIGELKHLLMQRLHMA
ncbi:MAG: glycine--tRNA ligase [Planctomycetes bacterium]|nr:glycine--tRNA ligase [Planctomycetota bacterium]